MHAWRTYYSRGEAEDVRKDVSFPPADTLVGRYVVHVYLIHYFLSCNTFTRTSSCCDATTSTNWWREWKKGTNWVTRSCMIFIRTTLLDTWFPVSFSGQWSNLEVLYETTYIYQRSRFYNTKEGRNLIYRALFISTSPIILRSRAIKLLACNKSYLIYPLKETSSWNWHSCVSDTYQF